MGRTVAAVDFSSTIKKVILAAADDMAAAEPHFASLRMTSSGMMGTLVTGSLPLEDSGWSLLGIAYLRLPAGEIFSLELFQQGHADAGGAAEVLQTISTSASPGPVAPTAGPGTYRLPPLQISVPADYFLQCHIGPNFKVYNIQKLQGLRDAAHGHLFFYLGSAAQPQRVAKPEESPAWAKGLREKGLILGKPAVWRVLRADGVIGSVHLGTLVEIGNGDQADLRVACADADECSRFQSIAESLAMVEHAASGAPGR
jgi:hypothetical protein